MRMSAETGYEGYRVIDDSTGKVIPDVMWVDDTPPQYAISGGYSVWGTQLLADIVNVTRIAVNYPGKEIHVNDPPPASEMPWWEQRFPPKIACDECCQQDTCRRIDYCTRFKCGFGEVRKP